VEPNRKTTDLALTTLRRLRANVLGSVLNEITFDPGTTIITAANTATIAGTLMRGRGSLQSRPWRA